MRRVGVVFSREREREREWQITAFMHGRKIVLSTVEKPSVRAEGGDTVWEAKLCMRL